MRKIIAFITILLFHLTLVNAQELEYKLEVGVMGGGSFYLGDANYSVPYKNTNMAGALMARYNINPRMSLKFDLGCGGISGDASQNANKFPEMDSRTWDFKKPVFDLGCQYEISFWAFGTGKSYKGTKRFTPYIQVGLGFTYGNEHVTMNIPVGFGVKYKLMERMNVGMDWTMRFSMSDKLDGISDPYKIKSGFLKNKDSYSWTLVYLTYDFLPKLRKCNND